MRIIVTTCSALLLLSAQARAEVLITASEGPSRQPAMSA